MPHLLELIEAHGPARQLDVAVLARIICAAGAEPWHLGGFRFPDGSVLRFEGPPHRPESWRVLGADEASGMVRQLLLEPLEVRLPHAFEGADGRERRSVAEGRFVPMPDAGGWRLVVEYEAFMDSPLFGLEAARYAELPEAGLTYLRVHAAQPGQRWRLEHIALHPDWVELLG